MADLIHFLDLFADFFLYPFKLFADNVFDPLYVILCVSLVTLVVFTFIIRLFGFFRGRL